MAIMHVKNLAAHFISSICVSWFRLRYGNHVTFGKNIIINRKFQYRGPGKLVIGDGCNLWAHEEPNRFFTYDRHAKITIGKRTRLNGTTIQSKNAVTIGNECAIGSAMLIDTDFHSIDPDHRNDPAYVKSAPIHIGNNVWLAGQCAILKGVTVHDAAVVGFRSVVTHDVAARTVVAGNPAREVKTLESL